MEFRPERIMSRKLTRRTFLGVLGAALITPREAAAQLIDPRPPGEIDKPKPKPVFIPFMPNVEGVVTSFDHLKKCDYGDLTQSGKASFYSHEGCLGCRSDQRMKNGQLFDENALTLANNFFPMDTLVKVSNQSEGLSTVARVTDGHGHPNRIADLSKALYHLLKVRTDESVVVLRQIICR